MLLVQLKAERRIPRNKRRAMLQSLGYDWHPGLTNGRVSSPIAAEGGKSRLFIRDGHIHAGLTVSTEISRLYSEAQGYPAGVVMGQHQGVK